MNPKLLKKQELSLLNSAKLFQGLGFTLHPGTQFVDNNGEKKFRGAGARPKTGKIWSDIELDQQIKKGINTYLALGVKYVIVDSDNNDVSDFLIENFPNPEFMTRTHKGIHLYYIPHQNLSDKIKNGPKSTFDIRGYGNSHMGIYIPGSYHPIAKKPTDFYFGDQPEELQSGHMDKLYEFCGMNQKSGMDKLRSALSSNENKIKTELNVEKIISYIASDIPMGDWWNILAGLKHYEMDTGDPMYQLAFDWSRTSPKHSNLVETQFRSWWDSIKNDDSNPITIATVIAEAKKNGYKHKKELIIPNDIMDEYKKYWVYSDDMKGFCKLNGVMPHKNNVLSTSGLKMRIRMKHGLDGEAAADFLDQLLDIIPHTEKLDYNPRVDTLTENEIMGITYRNTYRNSLRNPSESDEAIALVQEWLIKIIPDEIEYNHILNIITNSLYNQGYPEPQMCIFHSYAKGVGKGLLTKIIRNCFQVTAHTAIFRNHDIENKFNSQLGSAIICIADEFELTPKTEPTMKDWISNESQVIEGKGDNQYISTAPGQWFANTNKPCPFSAGTDPTENKYYVVSLDGIFNDDDEIKNYYVKSGLAKWLGSVEAAEALVSICYNHQFTDVYKDSSWRGRAPLSKTYQEWVRRDNAEKDAYMSLLENGSDDPFIIIDNGVLLAAKKNNLARALGISVETEQASKEFLKKIGFDINNKYVKYKSIRYERKNKEKYDISYSEFIVYNQEMLTPKTAKDLLESKNIEDIDYDKKRFLAGDLLKNVAKQQDFLRRFGNE